VELWTHDRARFPLPPRHRFPLAKYSLLRRRVVELGLATPEEIHETGPVEWALLERVHDGELLRRIRAGLRARDALVLDRRGGEDEANTSCGGARRLGG
jgi:acetoin utilization deacetylase AcuC-like enzyme